MQVEKNNKLIKVMTKSQFARSLNVHPSTITKHLPSLEVHLDNGIEYIVDSEENRKLFNKSKKPLKKNENLVGREVEVRIFATVTEQKGKDYFIDIGGGYQIAVKRKQLTVKRN